MAAISLSPTSYIVLGLLERLGGGTSYELKQTIAESVGNFWSVPHSQAYAEPDRLEQAGLLEAEREAGGRRRTRYTLTAEGLAALDAWRAAPADDGLPELRDAALLRLFMGADPGPLAAVREQAHRERLARYEDAQQRDDGTGDRGPWETLDAGIAHERESVRFWSQLAKRHDRG
jgi:DNA-binding PadR family transcriptional regulator